MATGIRSHVGRRVSALENARRAAGLSRERLAGLAGVTARTIYAHEVEDVSPQPATRHVIAEALGCTPDEIFPLNGQRPELATPGAGETTSGATDAGHVVGQAY